MKSLRTFINDNELPAIYLDMDETIVDWMSGADAALAKFGYPKWTHDFWKQYSSEEADSIRWAVLNKVPNFWLNLKWMKDGKKLWDFLKPYKPNILSAYSTYSPTSKPEKLQWLAKNIGLNNLNKVHLVQRAEKKKFAVDINGNRTVLIDDYLKNCNEYKQAGGIAIQVTTVSDVISKLKSLGFK